MTFTQEWVKPILYGYLDDCSKASSYPEGSAYPLSYASGARRHTCLDYYPTEGLGTKQYMAFAAIKTLHEPSTKT